ncbi:MAG: histidine kinase [Paracoccaceae bacterium]
MHTPAIQLRAGTEPGEVTFGYDELIYSRTDPRGVIRAGNTVFQRMCNMQFNDLIGAPHRVIRHPDMPKGFFFLFWQMLKQGLPAAGFVKNARKGGGHYWVLAAATPCDGGYCSIRMRPSTPLFETIKQEYAALVQRERNENLTAAASADILRDRLRALGFADYNAFAAQIIADEIRARDAILGLPPDAETAALAALLRNLMETLDQQSRLVAQFSDLVLLPVNMRLVAARLEPQGGPISQISVNYKVASEEIARRLSGIVSGKSNICGRMAQTVRQSLTLSGFARLQAELVRSYDRHDPNYTGEERRKELQELCNLRDFNYREAGAALKEAESLAGSLNEASTDLRRMILGLDTIRILARVESRKSQESQLALTATIDRIDEVQGLISDSLKRLAEQTFAINNSLAVLRRTDAAGAPRGPGAKPRAA